MGVCPPFGPKDFAPVDLEDVEVKRKEFMKEANEYYGRCYVLAVTRMQKAKIDEKASVEGQDLDFSCIFDGNFNEGNLFSQKSMSANAEFNAAHEVFQGELCQFQEFIHKSMSDFLTKGTMYFDSQLNYFSSDGGFTSNQAMTCYPLIAVLTM